LIVAVFSGTARDGHGHHQVSGIVAREAYDVSADTVRFLKARRPGVRFVFVMGADNLAGLHRWERWRSIAGLVPLALILKTVKLGGGAPAAH